MRLDSGKIAQNRSLKLQNCFQSLSLKIDDAEQPRAICLTVRKTGDVKFHFVEKIEVTAKIYNMVFSHYVWKLMTLNKLVPFAWPLERLETWNFIL